MHLIAPYAILAGLLLSPTLSPAVAQVSPAHTNGRCDHIIATGHTEYPPFTWRQDEQLVGASVEFARAIAAELDVPLEVRFSVHWNRALSRLDQGEIDMIVALYRTDDRARRFLFSSPVLSDPVVIFARKDHGFPFEDWSTLTPKRGAITLGDTFGSDIDNRISNLPAIQKAEDLPALLKLLQYGRVDYAIHGLHPLRAGAAQMGNDDMFTVVKTIGYEQSYMAFSRKSPCAVFAEKFSAAIDAQASGTRISDLLEKFTESWSVYTGERRPAG